MEECNSHHDCAIPQQNYRLPTRLLHIEDGGLCLVFSLHLPAQVRYATLSHCWGQHQPLRLLKSNVGCFETQVPPDLLCKTFKDSISIASGAGLRYIWIDSLCIIQDDEEDWQKESVLMADVYGNSYLNIAAAGASNGSEGCFFQIDPERRDSIRLITGKGSKKKFFDFVPFGAYEMCVTGTQLAQRGWALQERLLAPRTIHFGRAQLYWECNEGVAFESLPHRIAPYSKRIQLLRADTDRRSWDGIVRLYSKCDLTNPQDKLVALSGIIRKMQEQEEDQCVAGLWKVSMEIGLLWKTDSSPKPRPAMYVAPSWSWCSVTASVQPHVPFVSDKGPRLFAHVLDARVNTIGNDPLGALRDGGMSLLCHALIPIIELVELGASKLVDSLQRKNFGSHAMKISTNPKVIRPYTNMMMHWYTKEIPNETFYSKIHWDSDETSDKVFFLPILKEELMDGLEGLIIVPTNRKDGQYRRIGAFENPHVSVSERDADDWYAAYTHFSNQLGACRQANRLILDPANCAGKEAFIGYKNDERFPNQHWILELV